MKRSITPIIALCAYSALAAVRVHADTFYVDPDFSSLSVAVYDHTTSTLLTSAQVSGSDTTALGGTFDATIDSGYITFNSGDVSFNNQDGNMQPAVGGGDPSAGDSYNPSPPAPGCDAANYGLFLTVPDTDDPEGPSALAGVAAIRDAVAGLTSSAIEITGSGTAFDASQVTLGLTYGSLDYNINTGDGTPFLNGTTGIDGNSGLNSATDGGIVTAGLVTGIVIPVSVSVNVTTGGLDVDVVLSGQIAGTNASPLARYQNRARLCSLASHSSVCSPRVAVAKAIRAPSREGNCRDLWRDIVLLSVVEYGDLRSLIFRWQPPLNESCIRQFPFSGLLLQVRA